MHAARAAEEKAKLLKNIESTDKVVVRAACVSKRSGWAEPGKTSASGMEARKSAGRSAFPWSGRENRPGGEKNGSGKIKRPEADKREKIDHGGMLLPHRDRRSYAPQTRPS